MANKLVSIIIPIYNRQFLIEETLDSILGQSYANWECLIIDDGSTDQTSKIVNQYVLKDSRFEYYRRPENRKKGANACRNYGFDISKGDYIQWFDSDDLMHKEKLKLKVEFLEKGDVDFVVCEGLQYIDNISNVVRYWDAIQSGNVLLDHIIGKVNFHTNGPLFKRDLLLNMSLFNETLQRKQEWEFYTRLLTKSTNYLPLHIKLYYFRSHKDSINGLNDISTLKSRIIANKLVFKIAKQQLTAEELTIVRKQFIYKYILFFRIAKKRGEIYFMILTLINAFLILTPNFFLISIFKIVKIKRTSITSTK